MNKGFQYGKRPKFYSINESIFRVRDFAPLFPRSSTKEVFLCYDGTNVQSEIKEMEISQGPPT